MLRGGGAQFHSDSVRKRVQCFGTRRYFWITGGHQLISFPLPKFGINWDDLHLSMLLSGFNWTLPRLVTRVVSKLCIHLNSFFNFAFLLAQRIVRTIV